MAKKPEQLNRWYQRLETRVSDAMASWITSMDNGLDRASASYANLKYACKRRWKFLSKITARKVSRKEKKLAARVAGAIDQMDSMNSAIVYKAAGTALGSRRRYRRLKRRAERHKVPLLQSLAVLVVAVLIASAVFNTITAYEYSYNGKALGYVKDQDEVLQLVDLMQSNLTEARDREVIINPDEDIKFQRVIAIDRHIDNSEDVLKRLTYMRDIKTTASGIFIGQKRIAILTDGESAQKAMEKVKKKYTSSIGDNAEVEGATILQSPQIKEVETSLGQIDSINDAVSKMGEDTVTVQTVEVKTFKETAKYKTVKENTYELYETQEKVVQKGKDGKQQITARIIKNNGKEISRTELEKTVLTSPVDRYILIGVKKLPPLKGTGIFITPVKGKLTSGFGKRWGAKHIGIDLAAEMGTPIYASDGGTVIFSGDGDSYGKLIKIDHGRGMVTYYGHCSKLLVKKGKKVKQGQHIANVGSTGNSTGPHCHFQIDFVGNPVNPFQYLEKRYAEKK